MSTTTYPIALPEDLYNEVQRTASEAHLSLADAMRQAIIFGLPQVRGKVSPEEDCMEAAAETWEKLGPAPTVNYDKLETW